jgi:hypothetical protein
MATDVASLTLAYQELARAVASMQRTLDEMQLKHALLAQALLNARRGQWESAQFGRDSVEAMLVAINPALHGKIDAVRSEHSPVGQQAPPSQPLCRVPSADNCWFGRPYGPPIAFVVHTQSGGESGTVSEWLSSASQLSAHYSACVTGKLDRWIDPGDRAWSNGVLEPGNRWCAIADECGVDPGLNPNHVTITCETEDLGNGGLPVTDGQFEAVLSAAREAKSRYPESLRYLARHSDISPQSRAECPGDRWLTSGRFDALARLVGLRTVRA